MWRAVRTLTRRQLPRRRSLSASTLPESLLMPDARWNGFVALCEWSDPPPPSSCLDARSFAQCRCSPLTVFAGRGDWFLASRRSVVAPPQVLLAPLPVSAICGFLTPPAPAAVHDGAVDAQVPSLTLLFRTATTF